MTVTINDPQLLSQLRQPDPVELVDPTGMPIGTFTPKPWGAPPPGYKSPISDEEMARRCRDNRGGRPLADILRDLEAQQ